MKHFLATALAIILAVSAQAQNPASEIKTTPITDEMLQWVYLDKDENELSFEQIGEYIVVALTVTPKDGQVPHAEYVGHLEDGKVILEHQLGKTSGIFANEVELKKLLKKAQQISPSISIYMNADTTLQVGGRQYGVYCKKHYYHNVATKPMVQSEYGEMALDYYLALRLMAYRNWSKGQVLVDEGGNVTVESENDTLTTYINTVLQEAGPVKPAMRHSKNMKCALRITCQPHGKYYTQLRDDIKLYSDKKRSKLVHILKGNTDNLYVFDEGEDGITFSLPGFANVYADVPDGAITKGQIFEENPEYPGGDIACMRFINANLQYPPAAQEQGIQGKVICSFVVDRDGSICDIQIVRSPDPSLAREAVRVILSMPKWKPATQMGKPLRVKFSLPVMFRLT